MPTASPPRPRRQQVLQMAAATALAEITQRTVLGEDRNVLADLHNQGFEGVNGVEHGDSHSGAGGEQRVIDAYRGADDF